MSKLRLFAAAVCLAHALGCAPAEMSILVQGASFLDESCAVTNEGVNLIRGGLDIGPQVAMGRLPSYIGHFRIQSDLQAIETTVGDDTLASGARNDFIADTIVTSYATDPPSNTLPQGQRSNIYFVIPPRTAGSSGTSFIKFDMLTTVAAAALQAQVPPSLELLVTFYFEGKLRSAPDVPPTRLRTNQVTFPIAVRNGGQALPACTAPMVPGIVGPCGNSQEAFTFGCVTP